MGIKIDTLRCTGCGACTLICPAGVLMVEDDMKCHVSEGCTSCGLCLDSCSWQAITLEEKPPKNRAPKKKNK
jgi:electron transfer flavoprotein alpha subunit